ncbi:cyanoexosortase B [Fischerella thermalis CCMEE 5205]|uniref:Cyanoexosortase B n=1 Tax=Fischerella thermalis CCMEE 5318 TaxID=2019666 RepID=A0A2N6LN86_9CYAN|nr:cyanoexosortase B [Fischerella thermalis]PMB26944.1 cyanoexosortase B [Fischerella thermalis CCMEE 5318]PMB41410.1 cyanoexosortase B [Fischerella thermalis CCMEE 5205]
MLNQRSFQNLISPKFLNLAILAILGLLYAPLLLHWIDGWLHKNISTEHEYFSHGIIGLPFAAYIAWLKRKIWQRLPDRQHPFGAVLLLIGGIFYLSGVSEWVNLSFPAILAGLCLWFKGIPGLKLQKFSLLLVFLATPTLLPYLIAPYTFPLQSFIAGTAGFILNQFGMTVIVDEINIYVGGRIVEVAPYCAGLKMLFTTLYVGLMLLYWTGKLSSRRKTISFLLIAMLISISGNIIRNTLLTYFHGTGNEGAFHWLHDSWGGDMFSAVMLMLLIPVLNNIDNFFSESVEIQQKQVSG